MQDVDADAVEVLAVLLEDERLGPTRRLRRPGSTIWSFHSSTGTRI